jgi:methylmalonyl-CoA mutase N-terminal domain/subunit
MQILAEEMGLSDTADPLAGSYYIEWLTSEMEQRIVAEMRRVDEDWGGIVNAVSNGLVQQEVSRQAYETERKLQSGEIVKVGANRYRVEGAAEQTPEIELHPYRQDAMAEQLARLSQVKQQRDPVEVEAALNEVRDVCERGQNVMPTMLRAVRAYCTLGEIIGVMKATLGEYQEPVGF